MRPLPLAIGLVAVLLLFGCGGKDKGSKRPANAPAKTKNDPQSNAPTKPAPPGAGTTRSGSTDSLTYPPVVTTADLAERGGEMLKAMVRRWGFAPTQARENFRTACDLITRALQRAKVSWYQVRCDTINHPAFNANTMPGGIIVATHKLVAAYTNLAAAQVLYQKSIKAYLDFNRKLARAIVAGAKTDSLPRPTCPPGLRGCLANVARSPLFHARLTGLLTAIAAHEFGHVKGGHILGEFLRKQYAGSSSKAFRQMTGKQVDTMFRQVQDVALNQLDEYVADEQAAKYLATCWESTSRMFGKRTGDDKAGPNPMDSFFSLWFLMSMDQAAKQAGKAKPAFQANHPPAHLRAERVLDVIIRNKLPNHALARRAKAILFKKKR